MPMLHSIIRVAAKPIPAVISPKTHAVLDYIGVGIFFAGASLFWRRNKRAAIASALCGSAELAVSLLTEYPSGVRFRKGIPFDRRREMDLGLAAMTATMPEFLDFKDQPQRRFFRVQGALIAGVAELTDFSNGRQRRKDYRRAA
jgi:hypothetical protein